MIAAPAPDSAHALLAAFEAAAADASTAEASLRKRVEAEVAAAERHRAFAYRRLNLMRLLARATGAAEDEEAAVGQGLVAVRAELGWETETEAREATLSRLAPVIRATFVRLQPADREEEAAPRTDVAGTLAEFEAWYEHTYGRPFWVLLEREIEELPLVER